MNCIKCNMPLENVYVCPHCGHVDKVAKKIIYSSNWHYNQGLAKAKVRDLSGAVTSLSQSLKYNKRNTDARNLLGLIYYQMGEIVAALSEWVISVHFQERNNIAAGRYREAFDRFSRDNAETGRGTGSCGFAGSGRIYDFQSELFLPGLWDQF